MINSKEGKEVLRRGAQVNFWAFCCYMDWEFFHDKRRFFKPIALEMQSVVDNYRDGKAIKISVSMPPRAGKSYITSLFACFWLSQFPKLSVMRNACTATLYDKFSYDTRALIRSDKFKDIFPQIELASDKQNLGGWNLSTSKQVGYFGAGVGGSIIGFGANLAITDDLYKSMSDALSDTIRDKVKLWKESAHDSRKEKNCPEIYIGTRWTKSDIIGEVMDSGDLQKAIVIPALIDGKSFCEDVKSTEEYLHIKERIEESTWSAEYIQEPLDVKGLLLPKSELNYVDVSTLKYEDVIWSFTVGDPADTGGDKFAAINVWVIEIENKLFCYVKSAICSKDGIEVLCPKIAEKALENKSSEVYIEANGVGLAAVLSLKPILKDTNSKLKPFPSSDNKMVRILGNYEFVKNNFVFDTNFQKDEGYRLMIDDATSFLKEGTNDHKKDALDVLCLAAKLIKIKFANFLFHKN